MRAERIARVHAIQASMKESGGGGLLEEEFRDLDCLIRLTVEFADYLNTADAPSSVGVELQYVIDSVISGIDSFYQMRYSYSELGGATASQLDWATVLPGRLKEQFASTYSEFLVEKDFVRRFRLLLDLFKLQIVFAGMFADGD